MFTFAQLDDLALAARSRPDAVADVVRGIVVRQIGPLAEYVLLRGTTPFPSLTTAPACDALESLRCALTRGYCNSDNRIRSERTVEFSATPASAMVDESVHWISYLRRMQDAAERAGFGQQLAAGLVGAARELVSNVLEHSQRASTGFIGYRVEPPDFEFVVADRGVGALASLRSSFEFAHLFDTGDALRLCIQEGVSCRGPGHGFGFRPLFLAMAAQYGCIRIRSDDQAIEMTGRALAPVRATPKQKPPLRGFLANVSVSTKAD